MKIKTITYQHRRDFEALYECEGCGHVAKGRGYDDDNFHRNVIPKKACGECGKSSLDLGVEVRPLATKYPEGFQI
jgi:uncharacterized Zn finger protein